MKKFYPSTISTLLAPSKEDALVMWVDMLGYKNWLSKQHNLEDAERTLLRALRFTVYYLDKKNRMSALSDSNITSMLISDTIIFWSFNIKVDTLIAYHALYQALSIELSNVGLSLRGAISIGSFRIRRRDPRIILGNSIIRCATLESNLDAFVIAVDDSVKSIFLLSEDVSQAILYVCTFMSTRPINTKIGQANITVLNWVHPELPNSIIKVFKSIKFRAETGDLLAKEEMKIFCHKLLNTEQMIDTLKIEDIEYANIKEQWRECVHYAKSIITKE